MWSLIVIVASKGCELNMSRLYVSIDFFYQVSKLHCLYLPSNKVICNMSISCIHTSILAIIIFFSFFFWDILHVHCSLDIIIKHSRPSGHSIGFAYNSYILRFTLHMIHLNHVSPYCIPSVCMRMSIVNSDIVITSIGLRLLIYYDQLLWIFRLPLFLASLFPRNTQLKLSSGIVLTAFTVTAYFILVRYFLCWNGSDHL